MKNYKKDFPFFSKKNGIIFLDSSLTTLKPKQVIDSLSNEMSYSIPTLGGTYTPEMDKNYDKLDEVVKLVCKLINSQPNEIFFSSGATESINRMAQSILFNFKKGDHIIIGKLEHASNFLPWIKIAEQKGIEVDFYKLDENDQIDLEHLKSIINEKTKLISLTHVFNTTGTINNIKEVKKIMKDKIVFVDGLQSVGHIPVDVKELDVDFLIFSAHKMLGPTGISCIYLKEKYIKNFPILFWGGKMQKTFSTTNIENFDDKRKFIIGTPNYASIIAFGAAIDYLLRIGIKNIKDHCLGLADYLKQELSKMKNDIHIYNKNSESQNVLFAVKGVLGEDVTYTLSSKYNIYLRSGELCTAQDNEVYKHSRGVRCSFYIYNTKDDVDNLIKALKKEKDFSSALFASRKDRHC